MWKRGEGKRGGGTAGYEEEEEVEEGGSCWVLKDSLQLLVGQLEEEEVELCRREEERGLKSVGREKTD